MDLAKAQMLYIFKPPAGYRTQAQLEKRLCELKKKDQGTDPQISFEKSVPQIRDLAYYVMDPWWREREFPGLDIGPLLNTKIHFLYYRNWMKVHFDPSVDERIKERFYRQALEVELAVIPE